MIKAKLWIVSALCLPLFFAGCGSEAGASDTATAKAKEIVDVLKNISNGESATAAKDKLSGLVTQLKDSMPSMADAKDKAAAAMSGLPTALANISKEVTRIVGNADALAPIKGIIEKLQNLMPK